MGNGDVARLLQYFPRTACVFVPVTVHVTGTWTGLLVQLVYTRPDPSSPGCSTTLVAAHHPELGSLSYEMVDGTRLLTVEEWHAGAPRREGIWWSTATAASARPGRLVLVWHEVVRLVEHIGSVADAVLLAEHLDAALHVDVGRPRGRPSATRESEPCRWLDAEIDALERLLAQVEGFEAQFADLPVDDEFAGSAPAAQENRALWHARATIAAENAAAVRAELCAIRERARMMLTETRDARRRADARR